MMLRADGVELPAEPTFVVQFVHKSLHVKPSVFLNILSLL
jgi:hypothetical protein